MQLCCKLAVFTFVFNVSQTAIVQNCVVKSRVRLSHTEISSVKQYRNTLRKHVFNMFLLGYLF